MSDLMKRMLQNLAWIGSDPLRPSEIWDTLRRIDEGIGPPPPGVPPGAWYDYQKMLNEQQQTFSRTPPREESATPVTPWSKLPRPESGKYEFQAEVDGRTFDFNLDHDWLQAQTPKDDCLVFQSDVDGQRTTFNIALDWLLKKLGGK